MGKTVVDGNKAGSVFTICAHDSNRDLDVMLSDMNITGGTGTSTTEGILGGGILNYGKLMVTGSAALYPVIRKLRRGHYERWWHIDRSR